jgi:hypothetical protein
MRAVLQRVICHWTVIAIAFAMVLSLTLAIPAHAEDSSATAQRLSDSAFAVLNTLTSDSRTPGDVTGAMASFAGDAQTLSTAIAKGDRPGADAALAALVADRRAVDDALVKTPSAIDSSKWAGLKAELASIQQHLPADTSLAKAPSPARPSDVVRPPASEITATAPDGTPPRVEITSRVSDDGGLHLKGFLEGTDLKSAGIYDSGTLVKQLDLQPTPGQQRVLLDITLEQVSPSETIRVEDVNGRMAEARVADASTPMVESGGHEKMIELGGGTSVPDAPPIDIATRGADTAEIPSESPSKRHMHSGGDTLAPLSGVQINILGVQHSISEPNNYQVVGQIAGGNIRRAGLYIDGRLAKPIAVTPGADTSFNVSFTMFGSEASIRAYGNGDNFVESSIDLSSANGAVYGSNPPVYATTPYAVNPYASNPYGYPSNPYSANSCPPGYGMPAYGGTCQPLRTSRPWWSKIF